MNSAMMPQPGSYTLRGLEAEQFASLIQQAHREGYLENRIGYPDNLRLIRKKTGIDLRPSRATTELQDGDQMLVMRLKYRPDIGAKADKNFQAELGEADFEYFLAEYSTQ